MGIVYLTMLFKCSLFDIFATWTVDSISSIVRKYNFFWKCPDPIFRKSSIYKNMDIRQFNSPATILRNKNKMYTYGLVLPNMNHVSNYIARYEPICQHTESYCDMNYMLRYNTILHIMKRYTKIWNHVSQYEPYVDIWNNTAHMPTYGSYCGIWFIPCFHYIG